MVICREIVAFVPSHSPKPLLDVLAGMRIDPPPIWLMRQAGRYLPEYREVRARAGGFLDLCYTPELATEVTLQPIRRFGLDAAILFSDILVVPHALGMGVRFEEGRGPVLDALADEGSLSALEPERVTERLAPVYDAVARIRATLAPEVALIGFAGAPWTVASYMIEGGTSRDHAKARIWLYASPERYHRLQEILVETTTAHLSAQIEAGADAVQIFDSWAGALDAEAMLAVSLDPLAEIARRLGEHHPAVPVIVFPRGAGATLARYAAEPSFAALGIDQTVPPDWAAEVVQRSKPVQGNLEPLRLLAGKNGMREAVRSILGALEHGPHVFNLGHGVVPETPPEHVAELVSLVREGR